MLLPKNPSPNPIPHTQKKAENRKMENEFFDFLKNYEYDPWNQDYIIFIIILIINFIFKNFKKFNKC